MNLSSKIFVVSLVGVFYSFSFTEVVAATCYSVGSCDSSDVTCTEQIDFGQPYKYETYCQSSTIKCADSGPGYCGGTSGWTCFPAGTKVTMANENQERQISDSQISGDRSQPAYTSYGEATKNIEDVKAGDKILSQSETGERSISTVSKLDQPVREHMCQIDFTDGDTLKLTNEHPLMTNDGWKSINPSKTAEENPKLIVKPLGKGDLVTRQNGKAGVVKSISCWSQTIQAYNLILEKGAHTYFADGYLAHNKGAELLTCPAGTVRTCGVPAETSCPTFGSCPFPYVNTGVWCDQTGSENNGNLQDWYLCQTNCSCVPEDSTNPSCSLTFAPSSPQCASANVAIYPNASDNVGINIVRTYANTDTNGGWGGAWDGIVESGTGNVTWTTGNYSHTAGTHVIAANVWDTSSTINYGVSGNFYQCSANYTLLPPVNGGWTGFGACSGCSQSRTCTNPAPSCGGAACSGSATQACGDVNGACGSSNGGQFVSAPSSNLCGGSAVWVDNIGTDGTFNWTCSGTCAGASTSCSATRNFAPTFSSLILKDNLGSTVAAEVSNKNQICQSAFNNSRTINVTVNGADANGGGDITNIQLRWNGISLTRTSLVNGVANFSHTFTTAQNNVNTNNFEVNITDSVGNTTGWVSSGRGFKVWSCNVLVTEAIFDGSAGQACNNTGFTLVADASMGYSGTSYKNMSGGADATTNLLWGSSYLPLVNGGTVSSPDGDLAATGRFTRLIDLGVGTTICPSAAQFNVGTNISAYSTTPQIKVDLSYIRDQEGWFQGKGVDIRAKVGITSGVPITANSILSADNLSIGVSNNGMVSAPSFSNTNGWNVNWQYGLPHNWYLNKSVTDPHQYSYQTIYNEYHSKLGLGLTGVTTIGTGNTGIMFVNGNLSIDSDITVPTNQYLMVVVSGSINIGVGTSRVDGIYVASGGINAIGNVDNQLVINGVLYATNGSNIRLARSYNVKMTNNTTPAVVVNYRPDMIFALPGIISKVLSGWKEL